VEAELVTALVLDAIEREIGLHNHGVGVGDVAEEREDADRPSCALRCRKSRKARRHGFADLGRK
jgi:hypothetical protein